MVVDITGNMIGTISGFPDAALFAAFDLPTTRPARSVGEEPRPAPEGYARI
jgi:hypothetical protein